MLVIGDKGYPLPEMPDTQQVTEYLLDDLPFNPSIAASLHFLRGNDTLVKFPLFIPTDPNGKASSTALVFVSP